MKTQWKTFHMKSIPCLFTALCCNVWCTAKDFFAVVVPNPNSTKSQLTPLISQCLVFYILVISILAIALNFMSLKFPNVAILLKLFSFNIWQNSFVQCNIDGVFVIFMVFKWTWPPHKLFLIRNCWHILKIIYCAC